MNLRTVLAVMAVAGIAADLAAADTTPFPDVVRRVLSADYRGDRPGLQQLTRTLERIETPKLDAYRHYWRAYALWRRAVNGFNETPLPADLKEDLEACIRSFDAALVDKPGWIEARIGIVGCAGPLFFLAKDDTARRAALAKEYLPVLDEVREKGTDNPRALWVVGQNHLARRDTARALEAFTRGIQHSLAEARQAAATEPSWIPRWGGAENLMNLAYLYTHSPLANHALARAYAEGALVAAPEWHYVREILWPQILALPQPSPAPAPSNNVPKGR